MINKSLYLTSALAGALLWSAAAQAAPGETTGNANTVLAQYRPAVRSSEPAWLYDHLFDERDPPGLSPGFQDHGHHGDHGSGMGGGRDGGGGRTGRGHDGGHGGGGNRH